ncbi:V-set domain-containing T-cell activation inhibitor 1-like isoform X2 [Anoplopoma fimbria]|uniref:V-set domain-containing T-cell activation inhibitor 1-like isoform X2 n=1 Tax=Anoplopoma fimbria TaxID=229290 RepID=UPI0023EB7518|nr:V-set domain-containing T-cell activation inhibitor 1-like isoform X2 [Anoplopoma fimbria]
MLFVSVMPGRLVLVVTALLCCAGEASTDISVKILTFVGQTAILPCQISVGDNEDVPSLEWSKEGLKPDIAFLYRGGSETFEEKNEVFHFRTNLFENELKNGNLSLRLSNVRLSDTGTYKCRRMMSGPKHVSTVELSVGAVSEPKLFVVPGVGVTLQCEVSCWFPQPEITFLDAQGNVISAENPKSYPDSSRCVIVTRRATVQAGDRFTCRVNQSEINQTRDTEIYIPDNCMRSDTTTIILAVVVFILIAIIAFLCKSLYCNSEGVIKLLSRLSCQSSKRSNAEGQNPSNQAVPIENATTEHHRKVDELERTLGDKEEIIRRLNEELNDLRSKQSPVVCQPINRPQDQLPQDDKPTASTISKRPESGNFFQNKDSNPKGTHVVRSMSVSDSRPRLNGAKFERRSTISAPSSNRFSVLANLTEDEVPLMQ